MTLFKSKSIDKKKGHSTHIISIMEKYYYCSAIYNCWEEFPFCCVEGEFMVFPIINEKVDFSEEVVNNNFTLKLKLEDITGTIAEMLTKKYKNDIINYAIGIDR